MKKAFKKGDLVTRIASWDDKGTFYFIHAVVYSCGKKQMVLTDADNGNEMGRHFSPALGEMSARKYGGGNTFPRMTNEEAEAACIELAGRLVTEEKARLIEGRDRDGMTEGYKKAMQKNIDGLHEPRAMNRTGTTRGAGV